MKQRWIAALMAAVIALAGCAAQTFDASGCVNAVLQYMKTRSEEDLDALAEYTGASAEDVGNEYGEMFEQIPDMLEQEAEDAGYTLDDTSSARLEETLRSLFSAMSFRVGEAAENDDGSFDVSVEIRPVQISLDLGQLQDDLYGAMDLSQYEDMTEEQIGSQLFNDTIVRICDEIDAQLESPEYDDAETCVVRIAENSDGVYEPDADDLEAVGRAIVQNLTEALA